MPIITYIGVVFPFMESLSFMFLDDFEGNANISVAIESGSTVQRLLRLSAVVVVRRSTAVMSMG